MITVFILKTIYILFKYHILFWINIIDYKNCLSGILEDLSALNIFYVKMIQWIADAQVNNYDIIKKYTCNVEYTESEIDTISLLQLLNYKNNNCDKLVIDSFVPIKSGTISLIFTGQINDKNVIIKILRKNIEKKLHNAIDMFTSLGYITSRLPYLKKLNIYNIINNNKTILLDQLDYDKEIKNMQKCLESNINNKYIKIPYVYGEYTQIQKNVIVMEYLDGKTIYDLNEEECDSYHSGLNKFIYHSMFESGFMHGDMHPGNVLFLPNNVIGIIDFGIGFDINMDEQNFIYDFIKLFLTKNYIEIVDYLCDHLQICMKKINELEIKKKVIKNELNTLIIQKKLFSNEWFSHTDIITIMNEFHKINLQFNPTISNIILSTSSFLGLSTKISNYKHNEALKIFNEYCAGGIDS